MVTSTRRRIAAVALVLLVPLLGACGFGYQTDQVYQPGVGVNNRDGSVDVLGAVVVSSIAGEGTFVASLVNKDTQKDDSLVSVKAEGLQTHLSSPVDVKADSLVNLADTGAVSIVGDSVKPGAFARVTLQFKSGQSTEVNVPVVPYAEEFADVRLANPNGSPAASPSGSPSGSPSASPSASPSGGSSSSPSPSSTP